MTTYTRILLLALVSLVALQPVAAARARPSTGSVAVTLRAVEDVSFPFWCSWAYDWEERCWWDDGDRLPVGGDTDKVWRAGLRFSFATIPPESTILEASLTVRHDAVCLGPRKTTSPCRARSYTIDLHPILTAAWFSEREVDVGERFSQSILPLATRPEWLSFDVSGLVEAWLAGAPNNGLLLKLTDTEEDIDVGGPAFASSSFATLSSRPALDVVYLPPGG